MGKDSKKIHNHVAVEDSVEDPEKELGLYKTAQEYLDQVTLKVNTQSQLYQCVESYLFEALTIEEEYVVIVLKIMDHKLRSFYGGYYIVQQWSKKRKLFQTVHYAKPNQFFLQKQRYVYSMLGTSEECQWVYVVNFYQELYNKIRHPFFDPKNDNGVHELKLYVDSQMLMVATQNRIMWSIFTKLEDQLEAQHDRGETPRQDLSNSAISQGSGFGKVFEFNIDEVIRVMRATIIEMSFKSVFSSLNGEPPEFLQIFDIGSEGYFQKEILAVLECDTKIAVYSIIPKKFRKMTIFQMVEKFRYDKNGIGLAFREPIHTVKITNIGDNETIFLMTKGQGELQILTEAQGSMKQNEPSLRRNTIAATMIRALGDQNVGSSSIVRAPGNNEQQQGNDPQQMYDNFQEAKPDSVIKLKSHFSRRNHIYLEEISGSIRRLKVEDCKIQKPLKRSVRLKQPKVDIQLQELFMHLAFFSDYLIANTALFLSHGKILSIYDFKTREWSHILPEQQGLLTDSQNDASESAESYFGMQGTEIQSLVLNHIFQNSIYDCLVHYNNQEMKRVKYFNECQKTIFEKAIIFHGNRVKQIVRNYDINTYRVYGDIVERTYFLIENSETNLYEIWVCENGSRMTKLVRNMTEKVEILNLQNASSDLLAIYEHKQKKLSFYSIHIVRKCLDHSELNQYEIDAIANWTPSEQYLPYFYFNKKLYYLEGGNLVCFKIAKAGTNQARKEYNFKSSIKDFYMTDHSSVYYKDKNNIFRYVDLKIQTRFDIAKFPSRVLECKGAFVTKLNYCFATNRFSLFTSPFDIQIIPCLNNYSIDLMSSMNFEKNFVFWKQIGNKLHAFKQPNIVVSWNLDTGKVIKSSQQNIYIKGFQKHSEWNGQILLKLVKDQQNNAISEDDYPKDSREYEEEKQARRANPNKHLFCLVDINAEGLVKEVCRFLFEQQIGQTLYVSFPYCLIMNNQCSRFYSLEGKGTLFKNLKTINQFYEPQMKIGKPTYFSPDFLYRIYVNQDQEEGLFLNFTLTNNNLLQLTIKNDLIWHEKDNHPMIYFHDNDKIVYLTKQGVEKVFEIKKQLKKKRTLVTLQEKANCYYNQNDMILRMLYDQYYFKKEMSCQFKHIHMLRIRANIIKRGLLLNEYYVDETQVKKRREIKREYSDKNIGNFSYFIIDNYRRELNFSYVTWKIIEQIAQKKLSIKQLRKQFVVQLVFTILPSQETILHYLNDNYEELQNFLAVIYEDTKVLHIDETKDCESLEVTMDDVPFLPNLNGKTPIHNSISKNNTRFTDKLITVLADTDFDHHSRFIIDKIYKLVDQVPAAFQIYLDQRQKTTSWIQKYTRAKINPLPDCEFMMASNQIWCENIDDTLQQSIFSQEVLEVPMTMHILDLPNMQKFGNKTAVKLMTVLSETENIDLFNTASLRSIVELKWPCVKKAMVKYLFYPYLVLLFSFIIYSVYIFEYLQNQQKTSSKEFTWDFGSLDFWISNQKQIIKLIILGIAGYFISLELRSFIAQGPVKYLSNAWNYIDMISLGCIMFSLMFEYITNDFPKLERSLNSVSCFLLWIKFLYFLRMFRQSSKFISMIVAVISDMRVFLAVFVISMITFSQSMYIISNNQQNEEDKFISSIWDSMLFTYNISLGSWDTSSFGTSDTMIMLFLFLLSTLFLCIIMLNLLIAVISDTYARVESSSQNQLYKNFADLITENEYLVPRAHIEAHDQAGSYLYLAKLDQTSDVKNDEFEKQLENMRKMITHKISNVDRLTQDLAMNLSTLIKGQSQKLAQIHVEENVRNEIFFKQAMRKLDSQISPNKHHIRESNNSEALNQENTNVDEFAQQQRMMRRRSTVDAGSGRRSTRQAARPPSRKDMLEKIQEDLKTEQ